MTSLLDPIRFRHGPELRNRFMLAPLTNLQSHPDGTLSDEEFHWLTLRARGGFGLTMTCAAHVQAAGQGFPGQLGVFSDDHLPGLSRLAAGIKQHGSVAIVQLHHAGMRSPADLIGQAPLCPSSDEKSGARALNLFEIEQLREDFITAAIRADRAGFDGVELHGAHGYILCQFLSSKYNRRDDEYGGSLQNRARLVFEIIEGVRKNCRQDFILGLRLSPERFGMKLAEMRELCARLLEEGQLDFLDLSLWDVGKTPEESEFAERPLMGWFTDLDRGQTRLAVAGNIRQPADAENALTLGADLVMLGRAAVLHHDFPNRYRENPRFVATQPPVSRDYLAAEGLSPPFIDYMAGWEGFVLPSDTE
jgi:2,4-dienoyl-CoA reductase-like NADH-dependent reductase (Old Yellow Enzyme family)